MNEGIGATGLIREAFSNIRGSSVASLLGCALIALVTVGLAVVEFRTGADLVAYQRSFRSHGGYVAVASTKDPVIPAARCDALNRRPEVIAAGGLRYRGLSPVGPGAAEQTRVAEASGRLLSVWDPTLAPTAGAGVDSVAIGDGLAEELSIRDGVIGRWSGRAVAVDGVFRTDLRNPAAGRLVVVPVPPTGLVAECWIEFRPHDLEEGIGTLAAALGPVSGPLDVRPLVSNSEFSRDARSEFEARPQRRAWIIAGAVCAALFTVGCVFRRPELALYRALGATRVQTTVMIQLETLMLVLPSSLLAFVWALAGYGLASTVPSGDVILIAARTVAMTLSFALMLVPFGVSVLGRGRLSDALKDRV